MAPMKSLLTKFVINLNNFESGNEKKVHTKVFQTSYDASLICISGDESVSEGYKGIPILWGGEGVKRKSHDLCTKLLY